MTDEYELMSAKELSELRKEVELLKANPFGDSPKGKTLLQSIQELINAMNRLTKLFTDVEQEIVDEFEKTVSFNDRFQQLIDQNQKIAAGIVTVADMVSKVEKAEHIIPQDSVSANTKQGLSSNVTNENPQFGISSSGNSQQGVAPPVQPVPSAQQVPPIKPQVSSTQASAVNNSPERWQPIGAINQSQVPAQPLQVRDQPVPLQTADPSQAVIANGTVPPLGHPPTQQPSATQATFGPGSSPAPFPENLPPPPSFDQDVVGPSKDEGLGEGLEAGGNPSMPSLDSPSDIPPAPEHKKGLFSFLKK